MISIGQLLFTFIVLLAAKQINMIKFPSFKCDILRKIFPLPLLYFGNKAFGLGGTQALSLPMFTAIRRFSILMTMLLESKILGVWPSQAVQFSVWCMVGGALLAAIDDLSFTMTGYTYVMTANLITAAYGVYIKQKLDTSDFGKYGIMFYNSMIMIVPAVLLAWYMGDLNNVYYYPHWFNPLFTVQFFLSCCMGFMLTFSTILCTEYNSALTTAMVGCVKNVFVSYLGMYVGGDYVFSWLNYIALNISIFGSIFYSYIIFAKSNEDTKKVLMPQNTQQI